MTYTVLVTAVGGNLSSQAIRFLKESPRHRIRVVGVDISEDATGRHFVDAFYRVPLGGDPAYVETVAGIIAREKVDLVLPWSDEEALALAGQRKEIEQGSCQLACASAPMLRRLSDKNETFKLLQNNNIAVPAWKYAETVEVLEQVIAEFRPRDDFALKPARSRGNRDIYVINAEINGVATTPSGRELHMDAKTFRRDYLATLANRLPFIVMERLVAPAYDIDVLSDSGNALRVVPRRRINTEGMPFRGNVLVNSNALIELGRRVAAAANLTWLYDVDVMTSKDGKPVVLEINPRPSGSLVASIAAGVPLLDDLVSFAKGETPPPCNIPDGRIIVPYTAVKAVV